MIARKWAVFRLDELDRRSFDCVWPRCAPNSAQDDNAINETLRYAKLVGFGEGEAVQHIRRAQPEDDVFGDDRPREGVAFRLDELDRRSFDCVWRKMRAKLRSG
jgi:hypothetical protein